MARPKGSKNKPKEVSPDLTAFTKVGILKEDGTIEDITDKEPANEIAKIALSAAKALRDEPAKYQTAPMSNWAIENRKKKLGLKD